jgi:hypothetical protein
MSGMLERRIFEVLAAGREEATENSDFLVEFFCSIGLSLQEAEEIQTFWKSIDVHNPENPASPLKGVDIVHQFPRGPNTKFPCWAIVLMGEREGSDRGERFLGDEGDDLFDDNGNFVGESLDSIWTSNYGIFTYAQSPDLCIYYYELCRFFLTRGRPHLKDVQGAQVLDTEFSGADMMPDPRYAPENMFVRRFSIMAKKNQYVVSGVSRPHATSVRGPFLGPNPESQIIGIDNPGVTTYTPDEE